MNIWRLLSQLDDDKCSGTLVLLEGRKNKEKLMADGSKVSSQFLVFTTWPIRLQFGDVQIPFCTSKLAFVLSQISQIQIYKIMDIFSIYIMKLIFMISQTK